MRRLQVSWLAAADVYNEMEMNLYAFLLDAYRQSVGGTNHKPHSSEQIIKKYFILYNSRMDVFYDL